MIIERSLNLFVNYIQSKLILIINIWLILPIYSNAQFQKIFNTSQDAAGSSVVQTLDHGYFYHGGISDGPYVSALSGLFIKTDSTGAVQWAYKAGIDTSFEGKSQVISETDTGVTIAWQISDIDNFGRICLLHLDKSGNILWLKSFFMDYGSAFISITRSANGYLISGHSNSSPGQKLNLFKTDLNGNIIWGRSLDYNISLTTGNIIETAGNIISTCASWYGSLIIKLDSSGNLLSNHFYKDSLGEIPNGLIELNHGILLYGRKKINTATTNTNSFATYIDSMGNIVWSKTYVEGSITEFNNAKLLSNGSIVLLGRGPNIPPSLYPYQLVMIDLTGDTLKTNYITTDMWPGNKPEFGNNGKYIFAGYYYGTTTRAIISEVDFQSECNLKSTALQVMSSTGYTDTIITPSIDTVVFQRPDLITVTPLSITTDDLCLILNVVEPSEYQITVYPNPATNYINFHSDHPMYLQVTDIFGKLCLCKIIFENNSATFDLSHLQNGFYFVRNIVTGSYSSFVKAGYQ